ncbi:response regulator transcription factor [Dyadobacter diqingensis]|uniref:response regulator transcription factor n=1 Tax=Dyadobacter diqingensis TaxID=2938121 RepID=UPI0020C52D9E|nr:response regulator transcription factor [Dyadobacter diqingensis]
MNIAIIDKYPIIRNGLRIILTEKYNDLNITEAETFADYYVKYYDLKLDLIILSVEKDIFSDLNMIKKMDKLEVTILFDDTISSKFISNFFRIGIRGYLSKLAIPSELLRCVSSVFSGQRYVETSSLDSLLSGLGKSAKEERSQTSKLLTNKELQIATYLSEGQKTSWIANKLGRKPSTISTYKNNIYKKMNVDNILDLKESIFPSRIFC